MYILVDKRKRLDYKPDEGEKLSNILHQNMLQTDSDHILKSVTELEELERDVSTYLSHLTE